MNPHQTGFLESIAHLAEPFECIRMKEKIESLDLPFWSLQEIKDGISIKEEWGIEQNLIPFFGDWHDVFCLDIATDQVFYLDDQRSVKFTWPSTSNFIASLTNEPASPQTDAPQPTLISATYSEEFRRKAASILKKGPA